VFFVVEPDRRLLAELARSIDAGELRPVLGATVPLYVGAQAFAAKQAGGVPGKVALQVVEDD
jgi:NADPH:quinone reductase-like Zn-dependent oxidoreductase